MIKQKLDLFLDQQTTGSEDSSNVCSLQSRQQTTKSDSFGTGISISSASEIAAFSIADNRDDGASGEEAINPISDNT